MRRGLIVAAAAALLVAAGCGGEDETPEVPEVDGAQSEAPALDEQWESAGELDNMPPAAAADLEPPFAPADIATAFADAGLAEGDPEDLGTELEACDLTDCVRAFASGEVTVMVYMADEMAAAAAESLDQAVASGPVVLHYAPNETPEDVRADYEAALEGLIGG